MGLSVQVRPFYEWKFLVPRRVILFKSYCELWRGRLLQSSSSCFSHLLPSTVTRRGDTEMKLPPVEHILQRSSKDCITSQLLSV